MDRSESYPTSIGRSGHPTSTAVLDVSPSRDKPLADESRGPLSCTVGVPSPCDAARRAEERVEAERPGQEARGAARKARAEAAVAPWLGSSEQSRRSTAVAWPGPCWVPDVTRQMGTWTQVAEAAFQHGQARLDQRFYSFPTPTPSRFPTLAAEMIASMSAPAAAIGLACHPAGLHEPGPA